MSEQEFHLNDFQKQFENWLFTELWFDKRKRLGFIAISLTNIKLDFFYKVKVYFKFGIFSVEMESRMSDGIGTGMMKGM